MCLFFEFKCFRPRKTLKSYLCSKSCLLYQVSLVRAPNAAHTYATVGFGRKVQVRAEGGLSKPLKTRIQPIVVKNAVLEPVGSLP